MIINSIKSLLKVNHLRKVAKEELVHLFVTIAFVAIAYIIKEYRKEMPIWGWLIITIVVAILFIINFGSRIIEYGTELAKLEQQDNSLQIERAKRPLYVDFVENSRINNHILEDSAYKISKDEVLKAVGRIMIVSDYSPFRENLIVTQMRQEYYKAIESVIENNLENESTKKFHYVRYMQREPEKYRRIKDNISGSGVIDDFEFVRGDEQAYCHCKRILTLKERYQDSFDLELYVTANIPSIPSVLIIDKHKLLFTIPERVKNIHRLETAAVINFTDNSAGGSTMIEPFIRIVESLKADNSNNEKEVVKLIKIDDSTFSGEQEWNRWTV